MSTVRLAKILNDLGTNSIRALFKSTGLQETSVRRQAQAAAINSLYLKNNGFRGPFGFPIKEVEFTEQVSQRVYSAGTITFASSSPEGGKFKAVRVRFVGFHCIQESKEWSDGDEPYFIIGVAGANGSRTVRFGPYDDPSVNKGESRYEATDIVPVEAGITPPIVLGVVAMEYDEGSPAEAEAKVRAIVESIERKFDQIAGMFIGLSAGTHVLPEWSRDILIGWIPEGAAAVLGLGDDDVGKNYKVLFDNKADLVEWRVPPIAPQPHGSNEYNVTISVGQEDAGGMYNLFFLVDLAEVTYKYLPREVAT